MKKFSKLRVKLFKLSPSSCVHLWFWNIFHFENAIHHLNRKGGNSCNSYSLEFFSWQPNMLRWAFLNLSQKRKLDFFCRNFIFECNIISLHVCYSFLSKCYSVSILNFYVCISYLSLNVISFHFLLILSPLFIFPSRT